MEFSDIESGQAMEISEIKEWSFDDFLRYSILQALRAATEDIGKYAICTNNLEALMIDELENNIKYKENVSKYSDRLDKQYGDVKEYQFIKIGELAAFKFKEMIKIMKKKIPHETIGEV
jgi:hypothetical protein